MRVLPTVYKRTPYSDRNRSHNTCLLAYSWIPSSPYKLGNQKFKFIGQDFSDLLYLSFQRKFFKVVYFQMFMESFYVARSNILKRFFNHKSTDKETQNQSCFCCSFADRRIKWNKTSLYISTALVYRQRHTKVCCFFFHHACIVPYVGN